jgi:HAD superfamily hydrolase (TIGR01549 family)
MPKFNVVLFDLGATLIYFDAEWEPIMQQAVHVLHARLTGLGYALDATTFPSYYRNTARENYRWRNDILTETPAPVVLRRVMADFGYPSLPDEHVKDALAALYGVSQAHWHSEDDALPTLEALRRQGYRIGLVSNAGYDDDVQTLVDNAGLRPYLEFIISSAAMGIRKPSPRIFQAALDFFHAAPEQAVMIGDYLEADILGANQLGMGSVWITRRADMTNAAKYDGRILPDRKIAALSELPSLLEAWR